MCTSCTYNIYNPPYSYNEFDTKEKINNYLNCDCNNLDYQESRSNYITAFVANFTTPNRWRINQPISGQISLVNKNFHQVEGLLGISIISQEPYTNEYIVEDTTHARYIMAPNIKTNLRITRGPKSTKPGDKVVIAYTQTDNAGSSLRMYNV